MPAGYMQPHLENPASSVQMGSGGYARDTSDFEAPPGRAHHWCKSRRGVQHTWDAGKNLTDPDEQVLGDLPPDGQRCCIVHVLPDLLGYRLVVMNVF